MTEHSLVEAALADGRNLTVQRSASMNLIDAKVSERCGAEFLSRRIGIEGDTIWVTIDGLGYMQTAKYEHPEFAQKAAAMLQAALDAGKFEDTQPIIDLIEEGIREAGYRRAFTTNTLGEEDDEFSPPAEDFSSTSWKQRVADTGPFKRGRV